MKKGLLLAVLIGLLAGCASGPPIYTSSAETSASFLALQTTAPEVQAERFGVYAKTAGKSFIGEWVYLDSQMMAASHHWAIPGVVLEINYELPWRLRQALQYNPETQKIDVFHVNVNGTPHVDELSVLPDGTVEWPPALFGLDPATLTTIGKNGSLDRTSLSGEILITLREVDNEAFQPQVAEIRANLVAEERAQARERSRNRSELMGAIAAGLGQASQEIKAENQARELRDAQMRSEIMRSKDAEMRASSQRLAQQQRENKSKPQMTKQQPMRAATNSGTATLGQPKAEKPVAASRGKAMAWCMQKNNGEFACNGPLQNGGWGKTLKGALSMVDCSNGSGYAPTIGHGGSSFDCGRELRSTEQKMPTYDPFVKYKNNFKEGPVR